jgi:hypothetical protein
LVCLLPFLQWWGYSCRRFCLSSSLLRQTSVLLLSLFMSRSQTGYVQTLSPFPVCLFSECSFFISLPSGSSYLSTLDAILCNHHASNRLCGNVGDRALRFSLWAAAQEFCNPGVFPLLARQTGTPFFLPFPSLSLLSSPFMSRSGSVGCLSSVVAHLYQCCAHASVSRVEKISLLASGDVLLFALIRFFSLRTGTSIGV